MINLFKKKRSLSFHAQGQSRFVLPAGMTIGTNVVISGIPRILISDHASIIIGNNVTLNSNPTGYHAAMAFPITLTADKPGAEIRIGDNSRLHGCCLHAQQKISIGRNCLIASGVQILDANGHATEIVFSKLRTRIKDIPGYVEIDNYVWIGLNTIVLKNVTIGECSIVAANSVVLSGNYPAYSLIGGNPARVIHTYDSADIYPEDMPLDQIGISESRKFKN